MKEIKTEDTQVYDEVQDESLDANSEEESENELVPQSIIALGWDGKIANSWEITLVSQ